jgi:hypothetical protein
MAEHQDIAEESYHSSKLGSIHGGALGRVLMRTKMMTTLARIHGAKRALATVDDRSHSGTPSKATDAITAVTSKPAAIIDTGFVHDVCTRRNTQSRDDAILQYPRAAGCET